MGWDGPPQSAVVNSIAGSVDSGSAQLRHAICWMSSRSTLARCIARPKSSPLSSSSSEGTGSSIQGGAVWLGRLLCLVGLKKES